MLGAMVQKFYIVHVSADGITSHSVTLKATGAVCMLVEAFCKCTRWLHADHSRASGGNQAGGWRCGAQISTMRGHQTELPKSLCLQGRKWPRLENAGNLILPAVSLQCLLRKFSIMLTLKEKYVRELCCLLDRINWKLHLETGGINGI